MRDDMVLETERTLLRPWKESEADRVFDIYARWEVSKWLGSEPKVMESREEAEKAIARFKARSDEGDGYGFWAVERKSDGVVAGTQLLVPLKGGEHGEVEIGWHFHPDSWGAGLATESATAVRDYGLAARAPGDPRGGVRGQRRVDGGLPTARHGAPRRDHAVLRRGARALPGLRARSPRRALISASSFTDFRSGTASP